MDELEETIHRTWIQLLIDHGYKEAASVAIDSEIIISYPNFEPEDIVISIPTSAYGYIINNSEIKQVLERALTNVVEGNIHDQTSNPVGKLPIVYKMKLIEVEEGWQNVVRSLISSVDDPNQAVITELVFAREQKQPYTYNEMKFASKSEIRIAQEFESLGILFFPLPLAVRADTGNFFEDHREIDFLVCDNGVWGILEVSYHPDRFEKDAEKDSWFKKSGILCVQHYSAERCYQDTSEVVEEFLTILAQHKR